jgi:hypothetical protein
MRFIRQDEDMDMESVIVELKRRGHEIPPNGSVKGHDGLIRLLIDGQLRTYQEAVDLLKKKT